MEKDIGLGKHRSKAGADIVGVGENVREKAQSEKSVSGEEGCKCIVPGWVVNLVYKKRGGEASAEKRHAGLGKAHTNSRVRKCYRIIYLHDIWRSMVAGFPKE